MPTLTPASLARVGSVAKKFGFSEFCRDGPDLAFSIYPPQDFLADPETLKRPGIFERLHGTTWRLIWSDGQDYRFTLHEFLAWNYLVRKWDGVIANCAERFRRLPATGELTTDIPDRILDDADIRAAMEMLDFEPVARPASEMN